MNYEKALNLLRLHGQEQLLDYYEELDAQHRKELLSAIEELDFSALEDLNSDGGKTLGKLSPVEALSAEQIKKNKDKYEEAGVAALRQGKVAAVLLAGGQGTRLGWNAPKGTFNIGVDKKLSIFECQINNLLKVVERTGVYPHLFNMTSTVKHNQTVDLFAENAYFGYDASKIHFYVQKTAPAV
ncbi:MAG: UTP--glucose-1-phosphate uridylyltransferase, partial [Clostridia bacterium]|nr:UTP--glucose-1-phosphate uridylyltransferase [Clostridia bacterium]